MKKYIGEQSIKHSTGSIIQTSTVDGKIGQEKRTYNVEVITNTARKQLSQENLRKIN